MTLLGMFVDFSEEEEDSVQRTVFEAAIKKRMDEAGYSMADLLYEVFKCEAAIGNLQKQIIEMKPCVCKERTKAKKNG